MSTHHQDGSEHLKFVQSPHRKRVCRGGCPPCPEDPDGQYVYAERELIGFRGIGWDPADLPAELARLYRTATVTHTKSVYYSDGMGGWIHWKDYTLVFESVISADCNNTILFRVTGSLNGVIHEIVACPPSSFTMDFEDFVKEEDPTGGFHDELSPAPGSYPSGGFDTSQILAATENEVTYEYVGADSGGTFFKLVTHIIMGGVYDTNSIRDIVSGMLAEVPLTKGTPYVFTGVDVDGDPVSGTFGFLTKGATWNHAFVFWDGTDCCAAGMEKVPHQSFSSDESCRCSDDYDGDNYHVRVYHGRKQDHVPAAFDYTIPVGGGSGAGALLGVGVDEFIYGWAVAWLPLGPSFVLNVYGDTTHIVNYTVTAWGKKALLAREDPDDWTVFVPWIGEPTCMHEPGEPTTKCFRFYYPQNADSAVENPCQAVFVIEDEGQIVREIPDLTLEMEEDCPEPPDGEPDCPDGNGVPYFETNPCDVEE